MYINTTPFELGDTIKDKITGLEGIFVGVTAWVHGCNRIALQPRTLHEGTPVALQWFDEPQIEIVESGTVDLTPAPGRKPGGPRRDPVRRTGG